MIGTRPGSYRSAGPNPRICRIEIVAIVIFAVCGAAPGFAQNTLSYPTGEYQDYALDSGAIDNPLSDSVVVFSQLVYVPNSAWVRVYFSEWSLPPGSFVRTTSLDDGDVQRLTGPRMSQWQGSTAYFNGDAVQVELVAGPHTTGNRVVFEKIGLLSDGVGGPSSPCGICGQDNRTASDEEWSGRIMPVGCSGSIYNEQSCMVSAGHCIDSRNVLQFHVPESDNNCNTKNPPAADQFPIQKWEGANGGVGNDWSVATTGTNDEDQTAYERYGVFRPISDVLGVKNDVVQMWGYGIDSECKKSQTQQFSEGPISSRQSSYYQMNVDLRPGNSGSGLLLNDEIIGIVSHCTENCPNIATRVDRANFKEKREALCPAPLTYDVNIQSSPVQGTPIIVTPSDNQDRSDGITPFTRTWEENTAVTLEAPDFFDGRMLTRWTLDGVKKPIGGTTLTFTLTANASTVVTTQLLGDLNCDESVDFNDVDSFVLALSDINGYRFENPNCNWMAGDINLNGSVDFDDIDPFVTCIINSGCP